MSAAERPLEGALVLVLGWAGSRPRQLRMVVRFYEQLGARVLTAHAQVFRNMARPDGWGLEGAELANRIERSLQRQPAAWYVHLFSNAGFWTWSAAVSRLSPSALESLRGVVIDSAPGFPAHIEPRFFADNATRAMMPMILARLRRRPALSHRWLTPPVWAFMRIWYHLSIPQQREAEASLDLVARSGRWPHLVLFSDGDELCAAEHIEAFVQRLRADEREVEAQRWPDAPHVMIMIRHRAAYFERVQDFLTRLAAGAS